MFKRFDPDTDCSTSTPIKTSVQRGIKIQILKAHPKINEADLEEIIPKKIPLIQYKAGQHAYLYCTRNIVANGGGGGDEPIFFQDRDGPVMPTLKLVHKYPDLGWTTVKVDKGAISFILGGANIMCPGLTNKGGDAGIGLEKGSGVVILAENKENVIGVGVLEMSSDDIRTKNKGMGIEVSHFLGDGLYRINEIN